MLTHAGLLPHAVWQRLPVQAEFNLRTSDGRTIKYSTVLGDQIGRWLHWGGFASWEPETVAVFHQIAKKARGVLDIGANTGIYTLLACAANDHAHVIAFEPLPAAYGRLMDNIRLNNWEDRCKTYNMAVSNVVGHADFHVPFGEIPSSASLNPDGFRHLSGTLVKVALTTIDAVIPADQPVDLVKIDVEGFEHHVLQGMKRVLSEWHPALVVECNPDGPNKEIERIARDFGYRFFHLRGRKPLEVDSIIPDASERFRNFLLSVHGIPDEIR